MTNPREIGCRACRGGQPSPTASTRDLPGVAEKVRDQLKGTRPPSAEIVIGRLRRGVHSCAGSRIGDVRGGGRACEQGRKTAF